MNDDEQMDYVREHHQCDIWGATHFPSNVTRFWVTCKCGYLGGPFNRKNYAEDDKDEHIMAMMHVDS